MRKWIDTLPGGYRWTNSGGSMLGGANIHHVAPDDGKSGSLCGRYVTGTIAPPRNPHSAVCNSCLRVLASREKATA